MRRFLNLLPPLLFAAGLLVIWYVVGEFRLVSPVFLPPPGRAFGELATRFADGTIWEPIGSTVFRMIFGWLLASLVGIAIGAAIGLSPLARDLLEPTLEFLRPLPASAMIPVAILFFGGIWGVWGVFFAIPLAVLVKAVITAWPKKVAAPL